MNVADRFVVGVVELVERHNQKLVQHTANRKHKYKLETRLKPMNVADRFVAGVVELGEWHNQKHGAEYCKPKTRIQTSNKTRSRWTQSQQSN
jgi:hypothetical protein